MRTEPIARQANEVYTKAMYLIFDDQLYKAGYFVIEQKPTKNKFILIDTRQEKYGYRHEITVELEDNNYIHCSCGLFEHMGMLCRHALKVLTHDHLLQPKTTCTTTITETYLRNHIPMQMMTHLDMMEIPKRNIMPRWTKIYDHEDNNNNYLQNLAVTNDMQKKTLVLKRHLNSLTRMAK